MLATWVKTLYNRQFAGKAAATQIRAIIEPKLEQPGPGE